MTRKSFPVTPTGGELRDLDQPGYYPGYSTLAQKKNWEEATRNTVMERVNQSPPLRFFSEEEAALLDAVIERILPQDDRAGTRTIPILPIIDERLYKNSLNGFRYEDMSSASATIRSNSSGHTSPSNASQRVPVGSLAQM